MCGIFTYSIDPVLPFKATIHVGKYTRYTSPMVPWMVWVLFPWSIRNGNDFFSLQKKPQVFQAMALTNFQCLGELRQPRWGSQGNQSGFFWNDGIFTYIWLIFMVNVGKYTIHGWYGKVLNVAHLKLSVFRWHVMFILLYVCFLYACSWIRLLFVGFQLCVWNNAIVNLINTLQDVKKNCCPVFSAKPTGTWKSMQWVLITKPIGSMYGIFANIYHENQPNVGKYTIHGSYGKCFFSCSHIWSVGRWHINTYVNGGKCMVNVGKYATHGSCGVVN